MEWTSSFGSTFRAATVDIDRMRIKVARSENLRIAPDIARYVPRLGYANDKHSAALTLAIKSDTAIAAKVLRVANWLTSGLNSIRDLDAAILVLGPEGARSVVHSITTHDASSAGRHSAVLDLHEFWKHSLAVAIGAKEIGATIAPRIAEELYTAGLLHDIGQLVLERHYAEMLNQSISVARSEGVRLHAVESRILGFDHGHVGKVLASEWKLPACLGDAAALHDDLDPSAHADRRSLIVALANEIAHAVGFTNNYPTLQQPIDLALMELGLSGASVDSIMEVVVSRVMDRCLQFGAE